MHWYSRRDFVKHASITLAARRAHWFQGATPAQPVDLRECVLVTSQNPAPREVKALTVLSEECYKRSGLTWKVQSPGKSTAPVTIYIGLASGLKKVGPRTQSVESTPETYAIHAGNDGGRRWITVAGSDERGVLFGVGRLLRLMDFGRQAATIDQAQFPLHSSPKYPLRGHQLGYRPKTNSYDAWTVAMWDQYIRELAIFGANAIELIPPRSDDEPDSPLFPLPPAQMMVEMSRIADSYGMDVSVWYPAMDRDYGDSQTVNAALAEWEAVFKMLPRVDAVFVPGGDPGHTEPRQLLASAAKSKRQAYANTIPKRRCGFRLNPSPQTGWTNSSRSCLPLRRKAGWMVSCWDRNPGSRCRRCGGGSRRNIRSASIRTSRTAPALPISGSGLGCCLCAH